MIEYLVAHPPIAAAIWAAMYIFDYSATLWFARKYQQNVNRHITFEGGVELNPVFEKEIAGLRLVSPRFLILLTLMVVLLIAIGTLDLFGIGFEFVLGAFLLLWFFVDMRHLRNIYSYSMLKIRPDAMDGHMKQSYWLSQRMIAFDAFGFMLICTLAWLAGGGKFFVGGMLVSAVLAMRHFFLAQRKPKM